MDVDYLHRLVCLVFHVFSLNSIKVVEEQQHLTGRSQLLLQQFAQQSKIHSFQRVVSFRLEEVEDLGSDVEAVGVSAVEEVE